MVKVVRTLAPPHPQALNIQITRIPLRGARCLSRYHAAVGPSVSSGEFILIALCLDERHWYPHAMCAGNACIGTVSVG